MSWQLGEKTNIYLQSLDSVIDFIETDDHWHLSG